MGNAADAAPAGGCGPAWNPLRLPHGVIGHLCEVGPDGVPHAVAEGCRDALAALLRGDADTAATITHALLSPASPAQTGEAYRTLLLLFAGVLTRMHGAVTVDGALNVFRAVESGPHSPFRPHDAEIAGMVCAVADRDPWSTVSDILRQLDTDKHRMVIFVRLAQITARLLDESPP